MTGYHSIEGNRENIGRKATPPPPASQKSTLHSGRWGRRDLPLRKCKTTFRLNFYNLSIIFALRFTRFYMCSLDATLEGRKLLLYGLYCMCYKSTSLMLQHEEDFDHFVSNASRPQLQQFQ
jgi:hypothetical protein